MVTSSRQITPFIIARIGLLALCAYGLLFGGTLEGIVRVDLRTLSMALLTLVFAAWLIERLLRRMSWYAKPADLIAAAWGAAILISWVANGVTSQRSLTGSWAEGLALAVLLITADLVERGLPRQWFYDAVLGAGALALFQGVMQLRTWIGGWAAYTSVGVPFSPDRPSSYLGNANTFGTLLIVLITLAAVRIPLAKRWGVRLLWALYITLSGVLLLFTQSRGAWIGLGVGLLAIAAFIFVLSGPEWRIQLTRRRMIAAGTIGLIGVAALAVIGMRLVESSNRGDGRAGIYQVAIHAFLERPLAGHGPDSFSLQLMKNQSIPPEPPHAHAHNMLLHIGAELGIFGLLAAAFTVIIALRSFRRELLRTSSMADRMLLIGAGGALIAFAAHGMFDVTPSQPTILLLGAWLLGVTLGANVPSKKSNWRLIPVVLLLIGLLVTGWSSTLNYSIYSNGLNSVAHGSYSDGAAQIESSADAAPDLPVNWAAAGFVRGLLAAKGDHEALTLAIRDYEHALAVESPNAWCWINLAALYYQAGRTEDALRASALAAQYAPLDALILMNRGAMLESLGKQDEAAAVYRAALVAGPLISHDSFWSVSALRRSLIEQYVGNKPSDYQRMMSLIEEGQIDAARAEVQRQIAENGRHAMPYVNAALLEIRTHGDLAVAERELNAALFLYIPFEDSSAWIHYALSELAAARGDKVTRDQERALARTESVWSPDGATLAYNSNVAVATYFQAAYPHTLLPQVWSPRAPAEVLELLAEADKTTF